MKSKQNVRIGISGWQYPGWRGDFYPKGLVQRKELEYASRQFQTIELNGSFYSLQRPESFLRWAAETPENFLFSVKGSRFITHMKRLTQIEVPLANFFAQGILRLGPKLGPILWQFPSNFQFDADRLDHFFNALPKTHKQASALAKRHDRRLDGRAWHSSRIDRPLQYAVEIRHESFVAEAFIHLLRRHGIGLVVADSVEWPLLMDVSADFVYCRLHGSTELYTSGYDDKELDVWAQRVVQWATGAEVHDGRRASASCAPQRKQRDVYVYFDNDSKVRAPYDAIRLRERVNALLG